MFTEPAESIHSLHHVALRSNQCSCPIHIHIHIHTHIYQTVLVCKPSHQQHCLQSACTFCYWLLVQAGVAVNGAP